MIYMGNYNSWISPEWKFKIKDAAGTEQLDLSTAQSNYKKSIYFDVINAGYDTSKVMWTTYNRKNLDFNITDAPWIDHKVVKKIRWWFTELTPGQFMPMHRDPHAFECNGARYWIPLQDYEPGHVFIYEDQLMTNYKAGDVFKFDNNTAIHGAANISFTTRITLQITEL